MGRDGLELPKFLEKQSQRITKFCARKVNQYCNIGTPWWYETCILTGSNVTQQGIRAQAARRNRCFTSCRLVVRSETNEKAERAVRRVNERRASVSMQSGLSDRWWSDAIECHRYLRNTHDSLTVGKTRHQTTIRCSTQLSHHTIRSRNIARIHLHKRHTTSSEAWQQNVGRHIYGGGWSGDLLIADWDDLMKNIASEVHVKRLKSEEVQLTKFQDKCVIPCADGSLEQEGHVVSRHLRFDNFKNKTMTREATLTRRISGDYVYRHHFAPRGQLCVPQEPNGPIPLKQVHCRRSANKDKVGHFGGEHHRRLLERRRTWNCLGR